MSELKIYKRSDILQGHWFTEYCRKDEADRVIAELKDKSRMHDFFWEGCGFAKRGFKNSIQVREAFDRLEAENAELNKKLMPCLNGDCILTCEVVEKYGKENAELEQKLSEKDKEIESLKASHYAEMVDAGMRERRFRRALWLARAERAEAEHAHWATIWFCDNKIVLNINKSSVSQNSHKSNTFRNAAVWRNMWYDIASKCRAKAEQYK